MKTLLSLGLLAGLLTATLSFTGCKNDGSSGISHKEFLHLTAEEAEALAKSRGVPSRVIRVDGEPRPATMDYREDRVNFELKNGRVVKVSKG